MTSFSRRVLVVVRDLLGSPQAGSAVPAEGDPLPLGVAARLLLLRVLPQEPALADGGLDRGTAEKRQARREVLAAGLPDLERVDVRGRVELPVRCGRRWHTVALTGDGDVELLSHPDIDVVSERVAASLGGELLPCVRAHAEAQQSWPPPVADDGFRCTPISAGELLAFVQECRHWLERGWSMAEAAPAVQLGLAHGQVAEHLSLGLDLPAAVEWVEWPAADVVRWRALDFTAAQAAVWVGQGRSLQDAEVTAPDVGGRWLARWARIVGPDVPCGALAEWARFGVPVGVWGEAASRGLRAPDVPAWLEAGFTPVEVLRYAHLQVPVRWAASWRAAGFTAYVAAGFLDVGMTLEEAEQLRDLPVKAVQEAWTEYGTVEDVRRAVAG